MLFPFARSRAASVALALGLIAATPSGSLLAISLEERPAYVEAVEALQDGKASDAASKLAELIEAADDLTASEASQVRLLRLEALVRQGDPGPALTQARDPALMPSPESAFWQALAFGQVGHWADAAKLLEPLVARESPTFPYPEQLALNLAQFRHRIGDHDGALELLESLVRSTPLPRWHERALLQAARIEIDRGKFEEAITWIERPSPLPPGPSTQTPRNLLRAGIALKQEDLKKSEALLDQVATDAKGTLIGDQATSLLASLALVRAQPGNAARLLIELIDSRPNSTFLESAFRQLIRIEEAPSPTLANRFADWTSDGAPEKRRALALLFQGVEERKIGETDAALRSWNRFLDDYPDHPLVEEASIQYAESLIYADRLDEAGLAIEQLKASTELPDTAQSIRHLEARLSLADQETEAAMETFLEAVDQAPGVESLASIAFNSALAAVVASDLEVFDSMAARLLSTPEFNLSGDLTLERGLYEASRAEPRAFETLIGFIRDFPGHDRLPDAEIALAELYLSQVPSQPVSAREHLDAAKEHVLTDSQSEWLDYVSIWVEISASETAEAIRLAREFLERWISSPRRPQVLMVLGENFYREKDYAEATEAFATLAVESPESPHADAALLFAGKATSRTLLPGSLDRALDFWYQLTVGDSELAAAARHEEGLLRLSREQFEEAVVAFDQLIALEGVDPTLKMAALTDRGEALYAKSAATDFASPTDLEEAVASFAEVSESSAASKAMRIQANVRRGKCLEALQRNSEALDIYRAVVEKSAPAGPVAAVSTAEFDWYYRAGLAAIQLLQSDAAWEEAIAIADRVAQFGGPRSAEAAQLADRLRLRHFIWQDPEG